MVGFVCLTDRGIGVFATRAQAHRECSGGTIAEREVGAHVHNIPEGGVIFTRRDKSCRALENMIATQGVPVPRTGHGPRYPESQC